ncbi:putative dsRNA-binding protein [Prochlorococcus sp. AH-716-I19]|nr:putative dsRNA-binding protein [Prochlorococcus sp. AH-716-I19]
MDTLIDDKRLEQIIKFLNSLEINSKRFIKIINEKDKLILHTFNEALTHSSANNIVNYEKLEFFGDAVLRLSASDFIERTYKSMSVGSRSELRSQIVSDEWLTELGKKIFIEKVIIKGPKAMGDENSKDTIIAETCEALIGAIYKCFNSINEVNIWLDNFWKKDAELYLQAPYKYNAKSALQEWCQSQGFDLPIYKIYEVSKNHGDPKRFSCEIYINGSKKAFSFGHSHKKAEKNAASILIQKIFQKTKN